MSKVKILYVEDEQFLGKIVKESLESRGFEVYMESDGGKVQERFASLQPDVCVLDVMLPGKDGFAIAEEIRATDKEVPILFLTARSLTEDVVRGFTLGGNDYIRKPFSMEELIVRIQNVLRGKSIDAVSGEGAGSGSGSGAGSGSRPGSGSGPDSGEVVIGRYVFQLKRQALIFESAERRLSFRESELLKFLYEKRDRIIDRKEILNLIWGNDSFFNSRNLDVYITKLRSYLRDDETLEIITIKGVGYRFVM